MNTVSVTESIMWVCQTDDETHSEILFAKYFGVNCSKEQYHYNYFKLLL